MDVNFLGVDLAPENNQLAAYLKFEVDVDFKFSYTVHKKSLNTTGVDFYMHQMCSLLHLVI